MRRFDACRSLPGWYGTACATSPSLGSRATLTTFKCKCEAFRGGTSSQRSFLPRKDRILNVGGPVNGDLRGSLCRWFRPADRHVDREALSPVSAGPRRLVDDLAPQRSPGASAADAADRAVPGP